MNKLLSAGFARLIRNKFFYTGISILFLVGAYFPISSYIGSRRWGTETSLDAQLFFYAVLVMIVASAFIPLFLGADYGDGTIRNKIIVGHTRTAVYLSNLIVVYAACAAFSLAYFLPYFALGIPLLGGPSVEASAIVLSILGIFALLAATAALVTLIAMLNRSRAVVSTLCILGIFLILFAGIYIKSMLEQPEYYDYYVLNQSGEMELTTQKNPHYLTGVKREFFAFLLDFTPGGQAVQYLYQSTEHLWQMALYSLLIALMATGGGLFFFARKDLK